MIEIITKFVSENIVDIVLGAILSTLLLGVFSKRITTLKTEAKKAGFTKGLQTFHIILNGTMIFLEWFALSAWCAICIWAYTQIIAPS